MQKQAAKQTEDSSLPEMMAETASSSSLSASEEDSTISEVKEIMSKDDSKNAQDEAE